ncbi:MAG: rRNA maturation RNase YbeY [Ignavibacteriaceae bacterium]
MIKNLEVNNSSKIRISKSFVHKIVGLLKNEYKFSISSLLINFVSANHIIKINKKFLNHNYSTDIITFSYSAESMVIDSEIYISVEDAESNAEKFGVTFNEEILRLVIHGILHLLGYDDKTTKLKAKMKRVENSLCKKFSKSVLETPKKI